MPPHGTGGSSVYCAGGEIASVHLVSADKREETRAASSPHLGTGGRSDPVVHMLRGSVDRALCLPAGAVTTLYLCAGIRLFPRPRAQDETTLTWAASCTPCARL